LNILVYYPFMLKEGYHAASQLRPGKMVEAFKRIGRTEVVSGPPKIRLRMVWGLLKRILGGEKFDLVYVEAPTNPVSYARILRVPVINLLDHAFLLFVRIKGVPIGLFYRDVYWSEAFAPKSEKSIRERVLTIFQKLDLWFYSKYASTLFLPSLRMLPHIVGGDRFSKVEELPSGCETIGSLVARSKIKEGLTLIYVGGVSRKHYDMRLLFEAVADCPFLKLTCVFREDEWRSVERDYTLGDHGNINVLQAHGEKLGGLLERASLASIIIRPVPYWIFAMPYKLFEYIGHGLPVLASKGTAVGDFIEANDIGWTVEYDKEKIETLFAMLKNDKRLLARKAENVRKVISSHTWDARANSVIQALSEAGNFGVERA